jgi:hypothetical protein
MYSLLVSPQPPASITSDLAFGAESFPPFCFEKVVQRSDFRLKKIGSKTAQKSFLVM